jgi:carbamoyl-phosphate synthase large subunit
MNILITSASRKVSLVRSFQDALAKSGGGKVIAVDSNPHSPALYFADEHFIVTPSSAQGFDDSMFSLCQRLKVSLVIPTRDEELPLLAQWKERFRTIGTEIMVAEPATIASCQDKRLFLDFCREHGFSFPRTYDASDLPTEVDFPLFLKPRFGKSGLHATRVNNSAELYSLLSQMPDAIVQTFVTSPEYSIDLFADFSGRVLSVVPRERIRVLSGESFVSKTSMNLVLINEAIRLAGQMKLMGHNTIQCFFDQGAVKFIEVNPRFGGASTLSFAAGADSPMLLLRLLAGQPVEPFIGKFRHDLVMLRYTQDLFLNSETVPQLTL